MIKKFLMYIWEAFSGLLQGLMSIFGFSPRAPKEQHDNLGREDVAAAEVEARSDVANAELALALRSPEAVVHEYAMSPSDTRATVDLSPLSADEQDWLLGLSDGDLAMLAASNVDACKRSLDARKIVVNVRRLRERHEAGMKNPAPVLRIPDQDDDRWQHIADVIREKHPALFGGGDDGPVLKPRRLA